MIRSTFALAPLTLLAALAVLSAAAPARAEPATEILPEAEQAAWAAIGRVNIAGYRTRRMCSGVLIAPARVLTAAHCVLKGRTPAPAEEVIFVAGWRSGGHAGAAEGARLTLHPGFLAGAATGRIDIGTDLALIDLATPMEGIAPLPLALPQGALPEAALPPGTALTILGYRADRPHIATRHTGCRLLHRNPTALVTDCDVAAGTSGAPVLTDTPTGPAILAIVSARTPRGTLAALPGAWLRDGTP